MTRHQPTKVQPESDWVPTMPCRSERRYTAGSARSTTRTGQRSIWTTASTAPAPARWHSACGTNSELLFGALDHDVPEHAASHPERRRLRASGAELGGFRRATPSAVLIQHPDHRIRLSDCLRRMSCCDSSNSFRRRGWGRTSMGTMIRPWILEGDCPAQAWAATALRIQPPVCPTH